MNGLEAYIYSLRSKLYENLAPFVQEVAPTIGWFALFVGGVAAVMHMGRVLGMCITGGSWGCVLLVGAAKVFPT